MGEPRTLADRCQAEADRMEREYGKGYATAQAILREAAVTLRGSVEVSDEMEVLRYAVYILNKRGEIEAGGTLLEIIDWHTNHAGRV